MTRLGLLMSGVALLLVAGRAQGVAPAAPQSCGGPTISRWSAIGASYAATATFGATKDGWLSSLHGIAVTRAGELFVHDGKATQIFAVDERLRVRRRFGGAGDGPGELTRRLLDEGPHGSGNTLIATDSMLYLSDMSKVKVFRLNGRYVGQYDAPLVRFPISFNVRGLHASASGIILGYHDVDGASGKQRMQTWRLGAAKPEVEHELALAPLPRSGQRYITGARQARPVWLAFRDCVFVGDGASPWLVRLDLATGKADTVRLPPHAVPPFTVDAGDKARESQVRRMGVVMSFTTPPSALWRYMQAQMDPDGHLWIKLWRPMDSLTSPIVYRIDPSGGIHQERVPAFPAVFGPPGVYYARGLNPDTDEILIQRYDRKP